MATRREAREWAVQMLFQLDHNDDAETSLQVVFDEFWANQLRLLGEASGAPLGEDCFTGAWRDRVAEKRVRQFSERLVRGVRENLAAIDARLGEVARNWDIHRMGGIERSVLRLGIYELLFRGKDVPAAVVINEAVDVSKFFGTRESGRFVNGILDRVAKDRAETPPTTEQWSPPG